jgi:hypothetical protein
VSGLGAEHRNEGGQILFIEFCDWAIKKQLGIHSDPALSTRNFGSAQQAPN